MESFWYCGVGIIEKFFHAEEEGEGGGRGREGEREMKETLTWTEEALLEFVVK